jgi:hypothetical protein
MIVSLDDEGGHKEEENAHQDHQKHSEHTEHNAPW